MLHTFLLNAQNASQMLAYTANTANNCAPTQSHQKSHKFAYLISKKTMILHALHAFRAWHVRFSF